MTAILQLNDVSDLLQANVAIGDRVKTSNYHRGLTGGGAEYDIVPGNTGTSDEGSFIDLCNGLQARLVVKNETIDVRQFGAIANGKKSATKEIRAAAVFMEKRGGGTIDFCGGHYFLSTKPGKNLIGMRSNVTFEGNHARLTVDKSTNSNPPCLFYSEIEREDYENVIKENCTIRNFVVESVSAKTDTNLENSYTGIFVNLMNARNCVIENNTFREGGILISMINEIDSKDLKTPIKSKGSYNNIIRSNVFEAADYRVSAAALGIALTDLYQSDSSDEWKICRRKVSYGPSFAMRLRSSLERIIDTAESISNNRVENNTIKYYTYSGCELAGDRVTSNIIIGNNFYNCEGTSVECDKGASYNLIEDNYSENVRKTIAVKNPHGEGLEQAHFQAQQGDKTLGDRAVSKGNIFRNNSITQTAEPYNIFRAQGTSGTLVDGLVVTCKTTQETAIVTSGGTDPYPFTYPYDFTFKNIRNESKCSLKPNFNFVFGVPNVLLIENCKMSAFKTLRRLDRAMMEDHPKVIIVAKDSEFTPRGEDDFGLICSGNNIRVVINNCIFSDKFRVEGVRAKKGEFCSVSIEGCTFCKPPIFLGVRRAPVSQIRVSNCVIKGNPRKNPAANFTADYVMADNIVVQMNRDVYDYYLDVRKGFFLHVKGDREAKLAAGLENTALVVVDCSFGPF